MSPAAGIAAIAVAVAAALVAAYPARLRPLAAAGVVAWAALFAAAAGSGLLADVDARPPPLAIAMVLVIGGGIAFGASRLSTPLLRLPLAALVGVQVFRLPLELFMHEAARDGVAPSALTFAGANFDIVTGATAPIVAWRVATGRAGRRLVLAWNVLGLTMLAVIAAIAIATAPFVKALGDDQVNTWVTQFPYVWLPAILVVAALAGHVLVFRKLARMH